MTYRNHVQELREQREREEQHIKKILEFYDLGTKISVKLSDIETNCLSKNNLLINKYSRKK